MNESIYSQFFSDGEQCSFRDRHAGYVREFPSHPLNKIERAWWDGYLPRSPGWGHTSAHAKSAYDERHPEAEAA